MAASKPTFRCYGPVVFETLITLGHLSDFVKG